jgi:hypothetical protein
MGTASTKVSRVYLNSPLRRLVNPFPIADEYREFIKAIDGLRVTPRGFDDWGNPTVTIRIRPQNYKDHLYLLRHGHMGLRGYADLTPIVLSAKWPLLGRESPEMERALARTIMDEACSKLVFGLSLYMPGAIRSAYAYTNATPDLGINFACINELADSAELILSTGLSLSARVAVGDFMGWLSGVDGFWDGVPNTNVGRATSFLSHAHHYLYQLESVEDFVWIMAAIESLYTTGGHSILAQLKRRIKLVLPEMGRLVSEKGLGKLYDFRSRFLHGNLSVKNRFTNSGNEEGFHGEFGGHFSLATAIAVKTIHWAAENGFRTLSFEERAIGT